MTILGPDGKPLPIDQIPSILGCLRDATDAALNMARLTAITDAVNWGDLSCVRAEHFEDDQGHCGWRVWIDEAAPEADQLKEFVRADLAEHGWPGVEVVTEW